MEKLILSEEILKEFGVKKLYNQNEKKYETCKYFLEEDINKIIGQNEFDILNNHIYLEKSHNPDTHEIRFFTWGNCYIFSVIGNIITISNSKRVVMAQIRLNDNLELINYRVVAPRGYLEKIVTEKVYFGAEEHYDYIETLNEEEIKVYRLKPMCIKIEEKEFFELTLPYENKMKKSLLKSFYDDTFGNIRTINSDLSNTYKYLKEVFSLLKNECTEDRLIYKRRK